MKILPSQDQEARVVHRNDVSRSGLLVDHGHFPEKTAFAQNGQDHFSSILRDQHHLDLAGSDQEECVPRIILEDNYTALGIAALPSQLSERGQVGLSQPGEEGDLAQDLHRGKCHSSLSIWKWLGVAYLRLGRLSIANIWNSLARSLVGTS